jgi:hypothetical protein
LIYLDAARIDLQRNAVLANRPDEFVGGQVNGLPPNQENIACDRLMEMLSYDRLDQMFSHTH